MLTAGSKLGRYEIAGLLGTGGMGEVYRATDPTLGRKVAIKILPAELSSNPERLHRFEREARSASALNHPNIVTIYELGQHDGTHYLAMELIEGSTLRELLDAGALPIRRTIELAAQAAEGLAKAHEAGIAHRDIKPANLMVTQDGFVKILDFGLAKPAPAGGKAEDATVSGTGTEAGRVMGTPEYMSPEQAQGGQLDFRSDQFSFGVVLYEMITGKRIFRRGTQAETLVAVLRENVEPIGTLTTDAPAPLCWLVERCLDKDPGKRYASTRDLARELAAIRDRLSEKQARPSEARASNLPVQRTAFVGREKEVAAAKELLLRPDVRLLTVTGPGGIGKTRLAVEIGGGLAEKFPGGIHFIALAPLRDGALMAPVMVQTLGLRATGGQSAQEVLEKYLGEASRPPTLLILDNFEQLLQAAPMVAELLAAGPGLKILATSRAALHIYGEHEFPVPPLALPEGQTGSSLEKLSKSPAVSLFVQRAVAAKPGFELNRENAAAILEICTRLDGLPLAIELAAARVKVLSPSAMRPRLASRLQLLTGGARDLPQRQQTLRAAMDWSYDLLSPAEQKLFGRLSVFLGGCTLESAEAVCDAKSDLEVDLLEGMASMVDKSLLQQVEQPDGEARFTMLETIREYAQEKLEGSSEAAGTRRAHAAYCLVVAEEQAAAQGGGESGELTAALAREHDNFRVALEWLTDRGEAEWGLRLGTALFRYWEIGDYMIEGRARLEKLLKLPGAAAPTKLRARALFSAGVLATGQGDYAPAEARFKESLKITRGLGDAQGTAVSLNGLAVIARDQGNLEEARRLFEEALGLWREQGDQQAVARTLSNLASVFRLQRDYGRARSLYAETLSIFSARGDRTGVAWSLNSQGDVARDQGDRAAARELYEQGMAIFRELEDRWGIAGTMADLGTLAREEQNCKEAHSLYKESLKMFQELGHKRGIARLMECFACTAAVQSEAERALRLAGAAAALREHIGSPLSEVDKEKLEAALQPMRRTLGNDDSVTAWLEGWGTPMEKAIEELLGAPC
jgi:predicted ATPase